MSLYPPPWLFAAAPGATPGAAAGGGGSCPGTPAAACWERAYLGHRGQEGAQGQQGSLPLLLWPQRLAQGQGESPLPGPLSLPGGNQGTLSGAPRVRQGRPPPSPPLGGSQGTPSLPSPCLSCRQAGSQGTQLGPCRCPRCPQAGSPGIPVGSVPLPPLLPPGWKAGTPGRRLHLGGGGKEGGGVPGAGLGSGLGAPGAAAAGAGAAAGAWQRSCCCFVRLLPVAAPAASAAAAKCCGCGCCSWCCCWCCWCWCWWWWDGWPSPAGAAGQGWPPPPQCGTRPRPQCSKVAHVEAKPPPCSTCPSAATLLALPVPQFSSSSADQCIQYSTVEYKVAVQV